MATQKDGGNSSNDQFIDSVIWEDMDNPIKRTVQSLYHAISCKYIYLVILVMNFGLGIWVIIDFVLNTFPGTAFYVFEFVINIILLVDVCLRMWLNGWHRFWRSLSNIFEFCIVIVCLILSIITIARLFLYNFR